ncbi:MAG: AzlC family ABC transporter permease [Clostridia bacterium]|nr:AzlC family ABC transporter permease [Clostridia bacterium]
MKTNNKHLAALKAAFPYTIPILTGFLFLGIAYGILMKISGFSVLYSFMISLLVFAGSMQFVAVELLMGAFDPVGALLLTLMVNARHLFYGISMLEKYKSVGKKRWYLIFGLIDETFSINCTVDVPRGIDQGWFYFYVTLLNQIYWVSGATLGGIFGSLLDFNTEGLEFVMTALLFVLFLEQLLKEKNYFTAFTGVIVSLLCLLIFGKDQFIIPAMLIIVGILTLARKPLEERGNAA